jgi:RNA polymerase sigma-70 factor (ECF subfamily)
MEQAARLKPAYTVPDGKFLALFQANRARIYAYLLALVPHLDDADDLLQEVSVRLWQNFGQFRDGTDFGAWSFSFVRYAAMNHHRRKRRLGRRVTFSDELLCAISNRVSHASWRVDERQVSLERCVNKLPERARWLVEDYYIRGGTMKSISLEIGRSVPTVTKTLSRIRGLLAACVERTLELESK